MRVVDAWPAVEAQLVDIWLDAEHGDLLDVARRRAAGPRDLDVRMRVEQADELVGRPQRARAGLAVRQREHQIAEQLAAGAQRLLRRGRRKASDEQQLTVDSAGHDPCLLRRAPRPEHRTAQIRNGPYHLRRDSCAVGCGGPRRMRDGRPHRRHRAGARRSNRAVACRSCRASTSASKAASSASCPRSSRSSTSWA